MPKVPRTAEERKEADRERHRKTYEKKKEEISAKNLARYYKRKEADPNYHRRPTGRPAKNTPFFLPTPPDTVTAAVPDAVPVQDFSPEKA
jgi:hypothetical protein